MSSYPQTASRRDDFTPNQPSADAGLAAGLLMADARLPAKYFYDRLGSRLFEAICELDEYYVTRAEMEILRTQASDIAEAVGTGCTLIDLGAGNCMKAASLFDALQPQQYVPVDISAAFLRGAVSRLQAEFPQLPIRAVEMDFSQSLTLPPQVKAQKRLFFYPGSSIGNFTPADATRWLRRLRVSDASGALLIGVDLVKEPALLEAAYDDAVGVTAAFNRNILRHVNQILGSDFNLRDWRHQAVFNQDQGRIEMYLQACSDVTVSWAGGQRRFAAGERIHTENSYKYTRAGFLNLLTQAGFGQARCWTDRAESFLVCHVQPN